MVYNEQTKLGFITYYHSIGQQSDFAKRGSYKPLNIADKKVGKRDTQIKPEIDKWNKKTGVGKVKNHRLTT